MSALLLLFGGAFVLALSGAMMPGPVLTATISEVMKRGFRAGPLIVAGHAILEILLLMAVIAGLGKWLTGELTIAVLAASGGFLLVIMGGHMAVTSRAAAEAALGARADAASAIRGPILAGILTSLSNPYWIVWWATIGLGYAAVALKSGLLGLGSFYLGHIAGDLAWYSLVSFAAASGRKICPKPVYIGLLVVCGLVLIGLGSAFLLSGCRALLLF